MCDSDADFILEGDLTMIATTRWILMKLIKSCEKYLLRVFECVIRCR